MTYEEAMQHKLNSRMAAFERVDQRRAELAASIPELADAEAKLAQLPSRLLQIARVTDLSRRDELFAALRSETEEFSRRRDDILLAHGYPADYDAVKYECAACRDEGVVNGAYCDCVKKMVTTSQYAASGIGKALAGKTFDNYNLKYFSTDEEDGESERKRMETVLKKCRKFAESFSPDSGNLLLMGGTGLGKTHLSAAIAGVVAAKGYSVCYETAHTVFASYDAVRFGRKEASVTENYENCALLLLDDLGAETVTQQSVSNFFNLLNTRLIHGRPTVISTNLKSKELQDTYGDRAFSRILGEFMVAKFVGTDVRRQKNSEPRS